jgi:SAM-dependent methyltransferase
LLLDWTDLEVAINAQAKGLNPDDAIHRARRRIVELSGSSGLFLASNQGRAESLADRALPNLQFILSRLSHQSRIFDLGSGYGRHTIAALLAGHTVLAVEIKASVSKDLAAVIAQLAAKVQNCTIVNDDYVHVQPKTVGFADLVISTGVLQHSRNKRDMNRRLEHLAMLASLPAAMIYIEMLFDMRFDRRKPKDGRIEISPDDFEIALKKAYPKASWSIERTYGPVRKVQNYEHGSRSFSAPAKLIESTAAEYLITRKD